ncbi:3-phosphoshikimate 1-carboxyvinyltransferase [Marinicauda sp. Alg238-R41]|uniref:3-phosphoshikimate 1-carboxyvinyltransferase n=1 Tax=Marinicauda sp. Alg238-R41 TaxID=2993447 RepID=UPI0022E68993|nr:3-phosphoshikimate 1-carboxyvinyltransferase [Marinicauda sp. Alg238-R41]
MTSVNNPLPRQEISGPATARHSSRLAGRLDTAADKSCSHRAAILAGLAGGVSHIEGMLESEDVLATLRAVEALGARVERTGPGQWTIEGGKWRDPDEPLDMGNSGTAARLLLGAASRFALTAVFVGDASLSRRPMERVLAPLKAMGAMTGAAQGGRLPVRLTGGNLIAIDYTPPVASAQVKSAVMFAALGARGQTVVREPVPTRNHTENMLPLFGGNVSVEADPAGHVITVPGGQSLTACDLAIPGDPSSAAFAVAAGLIAPESELTVAGVMTNPARFGLYDVLKEMGAHLEFTPAGSRCGETLCDITVRTSQLKGVDVAALRAPSMIDEYPILAVLAAFAEGETRMRGLGELRAKESDRLSSTAALLDANGVKVEIEGDDLIVTGAGLAGVPGGGRVETRDDHRLAMAGLVLGLGGQAPVSVDETAMIATSYPGFFDDFSAIGANID